MRADQSTAADRSTFPLPFHLRQILIRLSAGLQLVQTPDQDGQITLLRATSCALIASGFCIFLHRSRFWSTNLYPEGCSVAVWEQHQGGSAYEALSYFWGTRERTETIANVEGTVTITKTLLRVLQNLEALRQGG